MLRNVKGQMLQTHLCVGDGFFRFKPNVTHCLQWLQIGLFPQSKSFSFYFIKNEYLLSTRLFGEMRGRVE